MSLCYCCFGANKRKSPYFGTEGSPKDWQAGIQPRNSAELEVVIDLTSPQVKLGKLTRETTATSNDPVYTETTIILEADVQE